jgi:hypothetical protein
VTIAFTIGAYRLCDFVHLALRQIRQLSPDSPILVSDDAAPESGHIKRISEENGAQYRGSTKRRGHFASDLQSFVNALAFAEAVGADVAIKASQRFILRKREAVDAISRAFEDPNILVATPGQPKVGSLGNGKPVGFGAFTTLSDIVAIRVGSVSPTELLHMYRERLMREKVPWGSFLECLIDDFHHRKFPGRTVKLEAITNHKDAGDPIYLRRYQNGEQQYRDLAGTHGLGGQFPLNEWGHIEGKNYFCKPMVV